MFKRVLLFFFFIRKISYRIICIIAKTKITTSLWKITDMKFELNLGASSCFDFKNKYFMNWHCYKIQREMFLRDFKKGMKSYHSRYILNEIVSFQIQVLKKSFAFSLYVKFQVAIICMITKTKITRSLWKITGMKFG